jgi:hypothetical protein
MGRLKSKYGGCGWCYMQGHDASSCPRLEQSVQNGNMKAIKFHKSVTTGGRVCGYCAEEKHSSTNCPKRFSDAKYEVAKEQQVASNAFAWLHEIGFGPGAMLSAMAAECGWSAEGKDQKMVVIEEFNSRVATTFFQELFYGQQRNWYHVKAVDTANENVRRIYLPFHPVYAPRPTSLKVEVLHKANPEDIDSMKKFIRALSSPLFDYDTAEEFFDSGLRFSAGETKTPKIKRIHS